MSGRESRNPISICLSDFQTTPQFSRLPCGSNSKESPCSIRDPGLIPGSGRSLVEWNGNPLQYSCLENPMDRGTWWATAHGVIKQANMTERLTPFFTFTLSPVFHPVFTRTLKGSGSPTPGFLKHSQVASCLYLLLAEVSAFSSLPSQWAIHPSVFQCARLGFCCFLFVGGL